jgi:stress-induced morphogen
MPSKIRGTTDQDLDAVMKVLSKYESKHSSADIEAYRQGPVSIRVRVVDPDFDKISRTDRHEAVWQVLDELSEDVLSQISTLLLLTPDERKKSFADVEFDDPVPSSP